jgi:hypothetical protein
MYIHDILHWIIQATWCTTLHLSALCEWRITPLNILARHSMTSGHGSCRNCQGCGTTYYSEQVDSRSRRLHTDSQHSSKHNNKLPCDAAPASQGPNFSLRKCHRACRMQELLCHPATIKTWTSPRIYCSKRCKSVNKR